MVRVNVLFIFQGLKLLPHEHCLDYQVFVSVIFIVDGDVSWLVLRGVVIMVGVHQLFDLVGFQAVRFGDVLVGTVRFGLFGRRVR